MAVGTILTRPSDIKLIENARESRPAASLPESWKDASFPSAFSHMYSTIRESRCVEGPRTFGRGQVRLSIHQQDIGRSTIQLMNHKPRSASLDEVVAGCHNISIAGVSVVEHPLSAVTGLGVEVQFHVDRPSMPVFKNGMMPVVDAFKNNTKLSPMPMMHCTVKEPVAVKFPRGAYVLFEPSEGARSLTIDHAFDHPKNALGSQRVRVEITPATYAYICEARTPTYGLLRRLLLLALTAKSKTVPGMGISRDTTVIVGHSSLLNPSQKFNDGAQNREPICHEILDKLAPLALLPHRFTGVVSFFKTSHFHDVEAMKAVRPYLATLNRT